MRYKTLHGIHLNFTERHRANQTATIKLSCIRLGRILLSITVDAFGGGWRERRLLYLLLI